MVFRPQDIGKTAVGTAFFWPMKLDGPRRMTWVIRESTETIQKVKAKARPAQKAMVHGEPVGGRDVVIFASLILLGSEPPNHSPPRIAWLNEHAKGYGGSLETLTTQDIIPVILFGDSKEMEHSFAMPNELRPLAQQALARVAARAAWTDAEFQQLVAKVRTEHPTPQAMWDAI